ncbi:contractile injection system protein, VgrG/Pvc8 family [Kingella kingae]|uniref:contractile injection system protein, VgrG/Pvc8 family n=1 Tax=Kingella kingae TaxID=504 RepID=UPI0002584582|nr:contractile injection system protein, VgrG/Pvc8 family [Kingella kingae]EIC14195.1 bacteriophage p2 tail protein gpd [Kingella kingae PYKK081]MDK4639908.1 contractile injection system protein, VgrG/Pvc8 family [Kingella kingae]
MAFDLDTLANATRKAFDQLFDDQGRHLTPITELTINGKTFGTQTLSRIISLDLTDKRGFEADELTIELDDRDGAIAIPKMGDKITLALGYAETGVVDKGEYLFSEFTHSGSPDTLHITARAADLAESLAEQKERSWHKQTLNQIVQTIATQNSYTGEKCKIAESYKNTRIDHIDQTNESDASFLSRLAEQYGAIATVKHGIFLFTPEGEAQTVNGKPIPALTITRQSGDRHSFTYSTTDSYSAVRAFYTDKKTGKRKEVVVDKTNVQPERKTNRNGKQKPPKANANRKIDTAGKKVKTLRHLYARNSSAWSGARTAFKKLQRGAAQFSITLAAGRPDLFPETSVIVQGFKPEIDREKWLITEVQHHLDDSGYTCSLKLEAMLDFEGGEE